MSGQKNNPMRTRDPGRTPGSAEKGDERETGRTSDPGHTPGTAEGGREVAESNLREQKEPHKLGS